MKHLSQLARRIRYWLRFARDGWGLRYSWWMAMVKARGRDEVEIAPVLANRSRGWMDMRRAFYGKIIDHRRLELMQEHGMTSDAALAQAFIEQAEKLLAEEE